MAPAQFDIEVRSEGEVVTVTPTGELDIATAGRLRELLHRQERRARVLVLDLSRLDFIDVVGLRVVLEEQQRSRQDGFALDLVVGSGAAQRLFDLARATELLSGVID